MPSGPHILAELSLREGQKAFIDVAIGVRADPTAFEVCCLTEDGSYAPVLVIDPVQQDRLRMVGHCAPRMLWGTLHPRSMPSRLLPFIAPRDGTYAVTQESGIGARQPTITAKISEKNGPAQKLRRFLGQSRRAIAHFSAPRATSS